MYHRLIQKKKRKLQLHFRFYLPLLPLIYAGETFVHKLQHFTQLFTRYAWGRARQFFGRIPLVHPSFSIVWLHWLQSTMESRARSWVSTWSEAWNDNNNTRCILRAKTECYCAYVLRISRYSDFLSPMLTNTGIFLHGLKLSGESRSS